jgi:CheY-like chemotaxis protein
MSEQTILIAEDNEDTRVLLTGILGYGGFTPLIAQDGVEALQLLRENIPAVILMDLMMPRMSGFELLSQIRADARLRTVPIIVMSAYLSAGTDDDILRLPGVSRVIPKNGFRSNKLLAAINELIAPTQQTATNAAA